MTTNDHPLIAMKVATETWIATALLHREHPDRSDFTVNEIVERAERERLHDTLRPGVRVHAVLHCVANIPPNPGRYRMLFATGKSTRRLFREGDLYDPGRERGKVVPERGELPPEYQYLLDWYCTDYAVKRRKVNPADSILALCSLGQGIWADEEADSYVKRLRRGWK